MTREHAHFCAVIAEYYGKDKQKIQAVQELSELILVLTRREDQTDGAHQTWQLIDEIADCEIMLEQMRRLFDILDEQVEKRIAEKLDRQLARISSEKRAAGME